MQATDTRYRYKILIQDTYTRYKIRLQDEVKRYKYKIDTQYRYKIQILHSYFTADGLEQIKRVILIGRKGYENMTRLETRGIMKIGPSEVRALPFGIEGRT